MSDWNSDQEWERSWHGNCVNSLNEELKQLVYARKMGLKMTPNLKTPYNFDLGNIAVVDIGGGPYSLLLKCSNFLYATVVDPCVYPDWVYERYKIAGIDCKQISGENFSSLEPYDEVWIYNVLQHTISPEEIIKNALRESKTIRIFEWIDTYIAPGHPHVLSADSLDSWLGGHGKTEDINEGGCVGRCYYGIFKGQHYGE